MEQLGIDPRLLIAQIVNFGVIVFVLSRLLYKPILSFLEKRKKEIAEGVALAEKMTKEQAHLEEKKGKMLAEARREGRALLEQAKKTAKEEALQIVEKAQKQASQIAQKAKVDAAGMKKELEKSVHKEAMVLAEDMVKRVLPKVLSGKDQHTLVAKHLREVESTI